jgi:hypothetical protein
MLQLLRSTIVYALIVTLITMGMSRVVVGAGTGSIPIHHIEAMSNVGPHAQHNHTHDDADLGTWECLKYCVDGAADDTAVTPTILSHALKLSDSLVDMVKQSASEAVNTTVLGTPLPRGPPFLAQPRTHSFGQDIIFRTGRLRI